MVKVPRRSLRYVTHRLMVMHPHTKYHWTISKDKNVMAQTRKYYLKNNYLTLRSKVKVPRRSLRYATHRLMVMHPHTKYNWPIWKDKSGQALLRRSRRRRSGSGRRRKIRLKQYVSLRLKGRHNYVIQFVKYLQQICGLFLGTSINKTDHPNTTEIFLKAAFNTDNSNPIKMN